MASNLTKTLELPSIPTIVNITSIFLALAEKVHLILLLEDVTLITIDSQLLGVTPYFPPPYLCLMIIISWGLLCAESNIEYQGVLYRI